MRYSKIKLQIAMGIIDDMERESRSERWTISGNMQYGAIKGGEWKYSSAYHFSDGRTKILDCIRDGDCLLWFPMETIAMMDNLIACEGK